MEIDPSVALAFFTTPTGILTVGVVGLTVLIATLLIVQSAEAIRVERDSSSTGFVQSPLATLPHYQPLEHQELSTLLFPKTYTRARRPLLNGPDTR